MNADKSHCISSTLHVDRHHFRGNKILIRIINIVDSRLVGRMWPPGRELPNPGLRPSFKSYGAMYRALWYTVSETVKKVRKLEIVRQIQLKLHSVDMYLNIISRFEVSQKVY